MWIFHLFNFYFLNQYVLFDKKKLIVVLKQGQTLVMQKAQHRRRKKIERANRKLRLQCRYFDVVF